MSDTYWTDIRCAMAGVAIKDQFGRPAISMVKSVVAIDSKGRAFELSQDPLKTEWVRLPDPPEDIKDDR